MNATTKPLDHECHRCEGYGVTNGAQLRPASHYQDAEHIELPCSTCQGSGRVPACSESDCPEPATYRSVDGRHYCAVCAELVALDAERLLHAARLLIARCPALSRDLLAKARAALVANDVEVAS
jgi:hypothetical protein